MEAQQFRQLVVDTYAASPDSATTQPITAPDANVTQPITLLDTTVTQPITLPPPMPESGVPIPVPQVEPPPIPEPPAPVESTTPQPPEGPTPPPANGPTPPPGHATTPPAEGTTPPPAEGTEADPAAGGEPADPDAPATTLVTPATKAGPGGWEVDPERLRGFGDAVVRARSYLDAVRMKVERMQGAELTPQLGTSPVGQQLAKKFDDRLNADNGLRVMLTEAMKRMEKFVASAEKAAKTYEEVEQNAVDTFDRHHKVEPADRPAAG